MQNKFTNIKHEIVYRKCDRASCIWINITCNDAYFLKRNNGKKTPKERALKRRIGNIKAYCAFSMDHRLWKYVTPKTGCIQFTASNKAIG